jgi:hypothetical protein
MVSNGLKSGKRGFRGKEFFECRIRGDTAFFCGGTHNKKSSGWRISVSAEGIEYHPPCGDAQQKILQVEDFDERGGDRTLNKRLKRPLLCH